ncbi:MAG: hypothetical protein CMQ20_04950 [Gammaproteobacteria bacterium]|nr:hypothetical protein [Gammaproteobacteria bacterium]
MDILKNAGALALGSRLRRLSDQLMQDGILVYRDSGQDFEPRWFTVCLYLKESGPSAVMDIARGLGVTHPSVNYVAKELMKVNLIAAYKDANDRRKRVLALTGAGKAKLRELEPIWSDIEFILRELIDETQVDFLGYMETIERSLAQKSFHQRYLERQGQSSVEIVGFSRDLADHFSRLNEDWISEYFSLEETDRKVLDDPKASIIDTGGEIVFARDTETGEVLGTCALVRKDNLLCELAKMVVVKSARGRGVGRLIGEAVVRLAGEKGFKKMYLESNTRLAPALGLYRELGFKHMDFPHDSDYSRSNVYMELVLF